MSTEKLTAQYAALKAKLAAQRLRTDAMFTPVKLKTLIGGVMIMPAYVVALSTVEETKTRVSLLDRQDFIVNKPLDVVAKAIGWED